MKLAVEVLMFLMVLHCSYAPPVTTPKSTSKEQDSEVKDNLGDYMEYHRYLKEVVEALESDGDFRQKLEKADDSDIRTGKIADHLDFVNHNVRTQLDEIKRREMERLKHLATREFELTNDLDTESLRVSSAHLDHNNPHTFEIEDLKRLIKKTTDDLAEADKKRREEFKEYEMQKEFEKHQKLETLSEQEKKEFEAKLKEEEKKQKHHPKVHHPGSKQQLEEVWEKQDHMESQDFNPKVFFAMHDLDGNGVWDADEVKTLFIKELDKMYSRTGNHTDLRERQEEMERMREHVFLSSDTNRDGLINYNEFLLQTKRNDFESDPEWKGIDENEIYTQQEYENYEKRRLEEMRYLQERGLLDSQGQPIAGAYQQHPQFQPQHQQIPQQGQYYQQHPNEIPPNYGQQHQGQLPPQGQAPYNSAHPPQGQHGYAHQAQGQIPQGVLHAPQQAPQNNQAQHGTNQGLNMSNQGQHVPDQVHHGPNQVYHSAPVSQGNAPQQGYVSQGLDSMHGQVPHPQQGQAQEHPVQQPREPHQGKI